MIQVCGWVCPHHSAHTEVRGRPPLPSRGSTPGFPNHQILNLTASRGAVVTPCSRARACRRDTSRVGSRSQRAPLSQLLLCITQSPHGSFSGEADSAAWHPSLCRVLLGFVPSLEAVALPLHPVYHSHRSDCAHEPRGLLQASHRSSCLRPQRDFCESARPRSGKQRKEPGPGSCDRETGRAKQ